MFKICSFERKCFGAREIVKSGNADAERFTVKYCFLAKCLSIYKFIYNYKTGRHTSPHTYTHTHTPSL